MRRLPIVILGLALAATLTACSKGGRKPRMNIVEAPARVATIGVNAYLWRAALDTLSFMPIAQVDSKWRRDRDRLVLPPPRRPTSG